MYGEEAGVLYAPRLSGSEIGAVDLVGACETFLPLSTAVKKPANFFYCLTVDAERERV